MTTQINSLHQCWCMTTGQELNLRATERIWFELANLDFTDADLLCVLKHVLAYNKSHAACPMKIQVHKLCEPETFASICADARARERSRPAKPTPRETVLSQFRHTTTEPAVNFLSAKEVISRLKESSL